MIYAKNTMIAAANKLENEGYAVLSYLLFPEECDELREAAYELAETCPKPEHRAVFSTTGEPQLKHKYFLESNDKIRPFFEDQALDEHGNIVVEPKYSLNKIGHALHLLHPIFRCYTYCDRVRSICDYLSFKEPAVVQSMVIYKNPGISSAVVPHQDATFLHTEPCPPLGFWIALEDATIQNGCLWVAKGSHKSGVHRRLIRNPDPSAEEELIYDRPPATYADSNFTAVPVRKGDCILLHGHVVHKSAINTTSKGRPAYTFHVIEMKDNTYAPENWLQEGPEAPFCNMYKTRQLM